MITPRGFPPGTYQLTDAGVLELLSCCPRLTGLGLPANSRITLKSLQKIVDAERPVGMALTSLSLVSATFASLLLLAQYLCHVWRHAVWEVVQ